MKDVKSARRILAAALLLFGAGMALAGKPEQPGKPGGGGGGDDPPPIAGEVYFLDNDLAVASILPDGSNHQQFPDALIVGDPSHSLHGAQRWFAGSVDVVLGYTDEQYPQPIYYAFPDGQSLASIEVGDQSGATVSVVNNPDIAILTPPRWAPDDLSISFIGERWDYDAVLEEHTVVVEAGLYIVDLAYDEWGVLGPIPGSLHLAVDLRPELRMGPSGIGVGLEVNRVNGHAWAPLVNGKLAAFVFAVGDGMAGDGHVSEIWTVDLAASPSPATALLVSDGNGAGWPEWSPDGSRIGYSCWDGIELVDLPADQRSTVRRKSSEYWGSPQWSPDGAHFAASRFDFTASTNKYDLYRFNADGRGRTQILADQSQATPLGWR